MSVPIIGHVPLSAAASNVVHRNVTVKINGVATVKDMISDPTFTCNEGDTFFVQGEDVDTAGSVSAASNAVAGTAQTPPPIAPTIGPVTFTLA
jgi:hypothetical protein